MKMPYFKLKDALSDLRIELTVGDKMDKATSVAKLLGKTVANVGMLSAELGIEVAKKMPELVGKSAENTLKTNKNLTSDQQSKLEEIVEKSKQYR
ncbi:hypothetical protein LE191_07315 [Janthinobacterium sp. HSC-3S05]|jgi:hypothetical protein|uniref:hypothetical protein n=1 Tax=Janthinobacterium lividum TaxID=29581 RepID=UPI001CD82B54|nr:hypothetical protein [Janthinobacterium lividum]MCA1859921.1 hypothetical protein [Janthinobacterium lividum]